MIPTFYYGRDLSPWREFVREIDALVLHLPDGAQRRTQFERDMRLTDTPDDYLALEEVEEGGIIVHRNGPGPKAVAFLEELRRAAGGAA